MASARRWGKSVHPHIRGAYWAEMCEIKHMFGSSPHTWGIRDTGIPPHPLRRFIPTYVGHTCRGFRFSAFRPVHPHIRGAYTFSMWPIEIAAGSSPHTWGIRRRLGFLARRVRFIPTYVGHTSIRPRRQRGSSVHPHIRGAYDLCQRDGRPDERFIPTYVGHTSLWAADHLRRAVHPHIRGAYHLVDKVLKPHAGSSPHTWGIRNFPPSRGD